MNGRIEMASTKLKTKAFIECKMEILRKQNKNLCAYCGERIPYYYVNCPQCGRRKSDNTC
ncbi:MAG: hypothetical protein ACOCUR_02155 [Nanoarchaeota archaeon]